MDDENLRKAIIRVITDECKLPDAKGLRRYVDINSCFVRVDVCKGVIPKGTRKKKVTVLPFKMTVYTL